MTAATTDQLNTAKRELNSRLTTLVSRLGVDEKSDASGFEQLRSLLSQSEGAVAALEASLKGAAPQSEVDALVTRIVKLESASPQAPAGAVILAEDDCTNPDPIPLWRSLDAADPSRHVWLPSGGPTGGPYRSLTVKDGDNFYGERCELGHNLLGDTFHESKEGDHNIVEEWFRLPTGFPLVMTNWQTISQQKEIENYTAPIAPEGVAHEKQVRGGKLFIRKFWVDLEPKGIPITTGIWYCSAVEMLHSADPAKGFLRHTLNGVQGAIYKGQTLAVETATGRAIPNHVRRGIYHDPAVPSCSIDIGPTRVIQA
jgi:hypothetical protein